MSRPVRIEFEGALHHVKSKRDEKLYDYNSRPDTFVFELPIGEIAHRAEISPDSLLR